jgi:hypothetical protein
MFDIYERIVDWIDLVFWNASRGGEYDPWRFNKSYLL